jgi:opacity protein-like surface antigen
MSAITTDLIVNGLARPPKPGRRRTVRCAGIVCALLGLCGGDAALAQTQPAPRRPAPASPSTGIRGFADFGSTTFTAGKSFEAVLGTRTGTIFGGGVEVLLPQRIFVSLRASRFQQQGERVFIFEDQTFDLGIATTVRVTPVEVTAGYRFGPRRWRLVPYAGGGIGWHRFEETSDFAGGDENVDETRRGYHLVAGADVRLARWFGVGGEAQWSTVPDALGEDPNSASAAFDETDLGGVTFRVKFIIGL